MTDYSKKSLNKIKRLPNRGHYDQDTIFKILDSHFVCHVSFVVDGQPFIIPTIYGRRGDSIYFHGSVKSRLMQTLTSGVPIALAVTQVDGIVVARSAFHSSLNYRSVVLFGRAEIVPEENKAEALEVVTDHIIPGRWSEARPVTAKELKVTSVLKMVIDSASAKIRAGGPNDEAEDYALPVWAGVIPLQVQTAGIQPDEKLTKGIEVPQSVKQYPAARFKI